MIHFTALSVRGIPRHITISPFSNQLIVLLYIKCTHKAPPPYVHAKYGAAAVKKRG